MEKFCSTSYVNIPSIEKKVKLFILIGLSLLNLIFIRIQGTNILKKKFGDESAI
ncbi:hypothetical protein [Clostridium perfringens]|uniref:hypothetical protein n=1 Tax=Clostridium perfringens TaxID=1502 RepID=UPI0024BD4311|nr:hypothetical protein [Clostridium perfringens]